MAWLRHILFDLVVLALIVLATVRDIAWARVLVLLYTPLVIIMRIVAIRSRLYQRRIEQAEEVPVWVYHMLYAASFALFVFDRWWLMAGAWALIWVQSAVYQARLGKKAEAGETKVVGRKS